MASALIQARVDEFEKKEVAEILEEIGLDIPSAIRIFFKKIIQQSGIPFEMTATQKKEKARKEALENIRACQKAAEEAGVADMTLEEINAEIMAYRRGE